MSEFITNAELRIEAERLCDENERLQDENTELVRVLHELEQEAVHAYRCLQHDCEQVLESEQHFFKKWWSSDCENAKLRELVSALDWCTENFDSQNRCDECPFRQSDVLTPECEVMMQELGIEVSK